MAQVTRTSQGPVVFLHKTLSQITSERWPSSIGNIGLAVRQRAASNVQPNGDAEFFLFWEWGGDWMIFEDGEEFDRERLDGWEPDALREAIAAAIAAVPECEEDMDWYSEWADAAEKTLDDIGQ